jgi:D-alanyl-D-alanine carboxypeptidase (penicillin-binding protein 5/6)
MNEQAKALGMKSTSYKNPEGLTEAGHTTTARDLSILATRLMQDFPEYMSYYAIRKYRYEGTPAANDTNRNLLLFRDPSVDGLKTGHTEAGRLLPDCHGKARLSQPGPRWAPAAVHRAGHGQRKRPGQ